MNSRDLIIGIMFLSQITIGIVGNLSLFSDYLFFYCHEGSPRATDFILKHLVMANILIILFKGVPHIMAAFGLKRYFNDFGCRFLFYFDRVGRSMSMVTICFLSVFQAITISPRNSCWKVLKIKATKYINISISLCWILYMMVNCIFPLCILNAKMTKNMTKKRDYGYCSIGSDDSFVGTLYAALFVFLEVLCSALLLWSSGSMVVILHRHQQQVQHIRSPDVPSRASPESTATRTILALVATFLTFYTFSSILRGCIALLNSPSWWLVNITSIISMCFPSFGPFVLMSRDSYVSRFCFVWMRNTKSSHRIRNM